MKKLFKSKLGMTYIEIIVALSLLTLIITAFTPMLLSSYEKLYKAGEDVATVYDSQTEMEEGLATRHSKYSTKVDISMSTNTELLFNTLQVKGKKIVSQFQKGFETLFAQERARVDIISPKTVNDDQPYHEISVQTSGLEYKKVILMSTDINSDETAEKNAVKSQLEGAKDSGGAIVVRAIIPNKQKNDNPTNTTIAEDTVYNYGYAAKFIDENGNPVTQLESIDNEASGGKFNFTITTSANSAMDGELDFTYSPVKIKVYYLNTRGSVSSCCDYLYIDPPSMIIGGEAKDSADYYTSAGVEEDKDSGGNPVYTFKITGRSMRTGNSGLLKSGEYSTPSNVVSSAQSAGKSYDPMRILEIQWIDNDEDQSLAPYYVMTGSNGYIYRMYNYRAMNTSDRAFIFAHSTFTRNEYGSNVSVIWRNLGEVNSNRLNLDYSLLDRKYSTVNGDMVYPSYWSGDYTLSYDYSSRNKAQAIGQDEESGNDNCWLTSNMVSGKNNNTGDPRYTCFGMQARTSYYYNGMATNFSYSCQRFKNMSYILTEYGWAIRYAGCKLYKNDFVGFSTQWHIETAGNSDASYNGYKDNSNSERTWSDTVFYYYSGSLTGNWMGSTNMGQIRLLGMGSYNPYKVVDNMKTRCNFLNSTKSDDFGGRENSRLITGYENGSGWYGLNGEENLINITGAIYIPSATKTDGTKTEGTMLYIGDTNAYARVLQIDNIGNGDDKCYFRKTRRGSGVLNKDKFNGSKSGAVTEYFIIGNPDRSGTTVHKYSLANTFGEKTDVQSKDGDGHEYTRLSNSLITQEVLSEPGVALTGEALRNFYLNRSVGTWSDLSLEDTLFSMGYSSVREKVFSDAVFRYDSSSGRSIELYKSFEHLYMQSHYGASYKLYTVKSEDPNTKNNNDDPATGVLNTLHKYNRAENPIGNNGDINDGTNSDHRSSAKNYDVHAGSQAYDNDFYNVWFPGELFNLNKVATKDGVTVAVGYTTVGSSFQYIMPSDDYSMNFNTSTALGGIYNDGVLAAMVEGKDDALNNILYFKDNDTIDNSSLYNLPRYQEAYGTSYGLHTRQSVRFTAVDIMLLESGQTGTAANLEYYAYYGDNTGRLFKSLVAKGTATYVGNDDNDDLNVTRDVTCVNYVADLQLTNKIKTTGSGYEDAGAPQGYMEEVKIGTESLSKYFSEITNIDIYGETIIVCGKPASSSTTGYIAVGTVDDSGNITFKTVPLLSAGATVTDTDIVGGYYYCVGYGASGNGFVTAVRVELLENYTAGTVLKKVSNATYSDGSLNIGKSCTSDNIDSVFTYTVSGQKLYAIGGRETK
ncbi:MAG: hypothetical protein ACI4IF_05430 [Acutalibacteraceae bacterium]